MALIVLPLGPVTSTQAPQALDVSQADPEYAVPKMPEGSV